MQLGRVMAVRYFVDPSVGPAALNIGSAALIADPVRWDSTSRHLSSATFAFTPSDCVAWRGVAWRGVVDSWRDSNGNEVDAIITTRDGWGAFEIRLNPAAVGGAAAALASEPRKSSSCFTFVCRLIGNDTRATATE